MINWAKLNRKPLRLLIILTLVIVVLAPLVFPFSVVKAETSQDQYYCQEFTWDYGGYHWDWNLSIPVSLYNAYIAIPDSVRTQYGLADFGYFTTTQDSYMQTLAQKLNQTATQQGYNSYNEVNFVLAFVQSIPYKTDNARTGYTDYPRFPVETLVDYVGDCKSHSILFATIMLILGYDTVFINPPDHLAVGILGNSLQGTYWTYNNKTYYYCETTGEGFKIGELPTQFNGVTAYVYPIDTSEQFTPKLSANSLTSEPNPEITSSTPKPTDQQNQGATATPTISTPTIQPVAPISINLIENEPVLFAVIILAIAISIVVTIKTAKVPRQNQTTLQPTTQTADLSQNAKYCIYCGASNKQIAVYCETCGKKIG